MRDEPWQGLWMQRRDPDRAIAPTESFCLPGRKLVALIEYQNLWNLIEREALKHVIDRGDMGLQAFAPASTTCNRRSASRSSSNVVLKAAMRSLGRSRINPTVSVRITSRPWGK